MRAQFRGHFGEPKEVVQELWKSALFVFDANVLLNLYRYSDKSRKEFLKILTSVQERSWLPEQCAYEFLCNRPAVIRDQIKAYEDTRRTIKAIKESFEGAKGHPFISDKNFSELSTVVGKIDRELTKNQDSQEAKLSTDGLKDEIADIFDGRVGPGFSEDELRIVFEDGDRRYSEDIPPGYKDKNKYPDAKKLSQKRSNFGDLILWKQILKMAKDDSKHVILVTDDQKEDWWLQSAGKTISSRPELIDEFHSETGQKVLIYTPNRFLQLAEKELGAHVSENTIDEIKQEHSSRALTLVPVRRENRPARKSIFFRSAPKTVDGIQARSSKQTRNEAIAELEGEMEEYEEEIAVAQRLLDAIGRFSSNRGTEDLQEELARLNFRRKEHHALLAAMKSNSDENG